MSPLDLFPGTYWLGLSDDGHEGDWRYVSGSTYLAWTNWKPGRPNGNGNFGHTTDDGEGWDDYISDKNPYVNSTVCQRGKCLGPVLLKSTHKPKQSVASSRLFVLGRMWVLENNIVALIREYLQYFQTSKTLHFNYTSNRTGRYVSF